MINNLKENRIAAYRDTLKLLVGNLSNSGVTGPEGTVNAVLEIRSAGKEQNEEVYEKADEKN